MRTFRHLAAGAPDDVCWLRVIGYRMAFPERMAATTLDSWFGFHFHDPVLLGEDERAHPGETVLVVAPGQAVVHRPLGPRLRRSWWRASGSRLPALVAAADWTPGSAAMIASGVELEATLLALHRASSHQRPPGAEHVAALLAVWLQTASRERGVQPRQGPDLARVRQHLESAWALPQHLDDLAALAGCSRSQLCRSFRAAVGCAPMQYLLRLRLEAAAERLASEASPIEAIAEACGFADRYHFSRAFARHFGCGPASWRRKQAARG